MQQRLDHYDRLRRYSLPVAFPLGGPSKTLPTPSPPTAPQGDAAPPGDTGLGAGGCLDLAFALSRFSRVGRPFRPPVRFEDYVME